jgi:hypothetical protein
MQPDIATKNRLAKQGGPFEAKTTAASSVFDAVSFLEAFDTTGGVDQLLGTGKERMAGGTNFHLEVLGGSFGLDHVATGTTDFLQFVFGMNALFHDIYPPVICDIH